MCEGISMSPRLAPRSQAEPGNALLRRHRLSRTPCRTSGVDFFSDRGITTADERSYWFSLDGATDVARLGKVKHNNRNLVIFA